MRKILLCAVAGLLFSCSKTIDLNVQPAKDAESRLNTPDASNALASPYILSSFTVAQGNAVKWGRCRVATSLIQWTATGETNISQYEVQKSFTNNFAIIYFVTAHLFHLHPIHTFHFYVHTHFHKN